VSGIENLNSGGDMDGQLQEIWTVEDVAGFLKMSPTAVYSLTRARGQARADVPLPVLKIHSKALRFRKSDVLEWVNVLASKSPQ
jgi:predicted DNA-binding transcriptional regulator AlpA